MSRELPLPRPHERLQERHPPNALVDAFALVAGAALGQQANVQDAARALDVGPEVVIDTVREIITLDPGKPVVRAVAVAGHRFPATGSVEEVTAAAGGRPRVDQTFAEHVLVPGFIADGKSVTAAHPDRLVAAETEKFLDWGKGMTASLPKQVKLFADGAISSPAMQVSRGSTDGHDGAWMMDPAFLARSFRVS